MGGAISELTPKQVRLIVALVIPLAALVLLTARKHYVVNVGRQFTLPIRGFDPRDLLSGHYLIYRIDYGTKVCPDRVWGERDDGYVCLEPQEFSATEPDPDQCPYFIRGTCDGSRFKAGIEKFFIPEAGARRLDTAVHAGRGELVISVTRGGSVAIVELLVDGRSYKQLDADAR